MGHYEKVKPVRTPSSKMKNRFRDIDRDYVPNGLRSDYKPGQLRKCTFCSNQYDKTSNMKNHTLNHFLEKIKSFLPKNKPFQCPTCGLVQRDIITLARHYAFTHKNVYNYCSEEELRGVPVGDNTDEGDGDYKKRERKEELIGHQVDTQDKSDSEDEEVENQEKNSSLKKNLASKENANHNNDGSDSEDLDEKLEDFANSELEGANKDELPDI